MTRHKQALEDKAGAPSYGQGVKDAVSSIEGVKTTGTSPLSRAMQSAGSSQGGLAFDSKKWSSVVADSENDKDKKVI